MNRHIIVHRPSSSSPDYERWDLDHGQWFTVPSPPHLPGLLNEQLFAKVEDGCDLTMSSHNLLGNQNLDTILPGESRVVVMPLGDEVRADLWTSLNFYDLDKDPIAGEKFVQKTLAETLRKIIGGKESWTGVAQRSIVVRHNWSAREIAPKLYPGRKPEPKKTDPKIVEKRMEEMYDAQNAERNKMRANGESRFVSFDGQTFSRKDFVKVWNEKDECWYLEPNNAADLVR